jgi:hypothetical protein
MHIFQGRYVLYTEQRLQLRGARSKPYRLTGNTGDVVEAAKKLGRESI